VKQERFMRHSVYFAAAMALVVSLPFSACARTIEAFDPECRTRPAEACPANPEPNPLLALAGNCSADLKRDRNCCVHWKSGARDYAIVKDCAASKPQGYLLIPVKPVAGVEDARIFEKRYVDLWAEAWRWSREFPGQPNSRTALAINSARSRSQPQLHIHISCADPEVSATLESADIPWYPAKPRELRDFGPRHHTYRAVRVRKLTGASSPFRVVIRRAGKRAMQHHGMAVIGSQRTGQYYVLDITEKDGQGGHAEELLDQRCEK
jgi:CDP-diacylglycerol pyrophosphatase